MIKRIKNNNQGTAFTVVLVAMVLFMMAVTVISMQINNQIKSSSKHYKNMEQKYLAESGIEKTIADISFNLEEEIKTYNTKSILFQNVETKNNSKKYISFLKKSISNINKAQAHIKSNNGNGNGNSKPKQQLENIKQNIEKISQNGNMSSLMNETFSIINTLNDISKKTNNNELNNEKSFKSEMLNAQKELYYALGYMYDDEKNHTNHKPVDLEMNKIRDISNQIVSNNIYNGGNGLGQIYNDLFNLDQGNGGIKLENELYKHIEVLRNDIWLYLGTGGSSLIFELSDYVNNNKITDRKNEGYQTRVNKIGTYIDKQIEKLIYIETEFDKLYIESKDNSDILKNKIIEIKKKIESVKYYLYEVKCKLGIYNTQESTTTQSTITINLPGYKYPNESTYRLNGYERNNLTIPVIINYNGTSISSVESVTVDNIKTIGYKENNEYKMKASITFNVGKQDGTYKVISYKINTWEKE